MTNLYSPEWSIAVGLSAQTALEVSDSWLQTSIRTTFAECADETTAIRNDRAIKGGFYVAEIIKHAYDSLYCIRHTLRELPPQKRHGNEDIAESLSHLNYSLLKDRCQTAEEANRYMKELEKSIFKYNRKGIIKTIEIVIQKPSDCDQEEAFFKTAYQYVCEHVLAMGERAVICSTVHKDEHKYLKDENGDFKLDKSGNKIDISKPHLHIIAVPAVPDKKHAGFKWKLSAHDLTSKSRLKQFHPGLQKACDDAGIHATVYQKREGNSQVIALSARQLKEITDKTGIVLEKSLTINALAGLIQQHKDIKINEKRLQKKLNAYLEQTDALFELLAAQDKDITELHSSLQSRDAEIKKLQEQLVQAQERISPLDRNRAMEESWGSNNGWGSTTHAITTDDEKLW